MDQLRQLQNNLRMARETINHLNQQLTNSEQIVQNLGNQINQNQFQNQPHTYSHSPHYQGNQNPGPGGQYNPYSRQTGSNFQEHNNFNNQQDNNYSNQENNDYSNQQDNNQSEFEYSRDNEFESDEE